MDQNAETAAFVWSVGFPLVLSVLHKIFMEDIPFFHARFIKRTRLSSAPAPERTGCSSGSDRGDPPICGAPRPMPHPISLDIQRNRGKKCAQGRRHRLTPKYCKTAPLDSPVRQRLPLPPGRKQAAPYDFIREASLEAVTRTSQSKGAQAATAGNASLMNSRLRPSHALCKC